MENKNLQLYQEAYESKFAWRKERQIYNLSELYQISGDEDSAILLKGIWGDRVSNDPKDALKVSILDLWLEARECYVYGEFQVCVIACGAVVERCLKLEYQKFHGKLPKEQLTLGVSIKKCRDIVDSGVLEWAFQVKELRDNRAHALLEYTNPQNAMFGGDRGIEILSPSHYLIEPYRGEARIVVELTYKILMKLYGAQES